jgi:hypothetical protein
MAEYLVNLNNGKTDEKAAFRLIGKLLNQSGVLDATGLTVSATTPTPDMTVKVSGSVASDNVVFITSTGDTYHGWNTAQYSVTILSNSTGATKYDAIVAYADTAAGSTTANNPGGLKFIAVRSSGAGVVSSADIAASAVGTKPYLRLADVTVANGVSSINSGNIVDTRPLARLGNGLVAASGIASGFTTGKTTEWFPSATVNSTTSSTFVQVGTFSDTFTFSGGPFQVALSVANFTNAGGNVRFGLKINATSYEIVPTTSGSGYSLAGVAFFAAGTVTGLQTIQPVYLNANSAAVTIPAYNAIRCTINDWAK